MELTERILEVSYAGEKEIGLRNLKEFGYYLHLFKRHIFELSEESRDKDTEEVIKHYLRSYNRRGLILPTHSLELGAVNCVGDVCFFLSLAENLDEDLFDSPYPARLPDHVIIGKWEAGKWKHITF